ncbi:MAG TPA: TetR/AcrR family transcriptional regulator [Solirubrobacteraceae bacterium]|jgi:AcrR family transcriptional regulator|nr:TetR/AcrR family transcriptional regulator [Solirubrobacteraceae bacterium]
MIECVDKWGYTEMTVAQLIALAGVSRRAFYEQFGNKEECFLATYDIVIARSKKKVTEAWNTDRGWANRLHRSYQAFLDDAVRNAKGSRLAYISALGVGPKARTRTVLAKASYERLVAKALKAAPDAGKQLPSIVPCAIVGGTRYVTFSRLREGREGELPGLTDELLDWLSTYRCPAAGRLNMPTIERPPRAPVARTGFLVDEDKRSRALAAVMRLMIADGYAGLSDSKIAQEAGISTEAFHRHFETREECLLVALDEFSDEAIEVARSAGENASDWPEAVYLGTKAFADYVAAHPGLARVTLVDIYDLGFGMVDRLAGIVEKFVRALQEYGPEPLRGPIVSAEAVTGAIWSVLDACAQRNKLRSVGNLSDHLAFLVLAPYIGPKPAVESIEGTRRRLVRG